jgi:hypothetical protein
MALCVCQLIEAGGGDHVWGLCNHRGHIEWQCPLSGVHSIMMVKSAQSGEGGGGCTPSTFHSFYYHKQSLHVITSIMLILIYGNYQYLGIKGWFMKEVFFSKSLLPNGCRSSKSLKNPLTGPEAWNPKHLWIRRVSNFLLFGMCIIRIRAKFEMYKKN